MIRIGTPYIYEKEDLVYLCADINISEDAAAKFREITGTIRNTARDRKTYIRRYDRCGTGRLLPWQNT